MKVFENWCALEKVRALPAAPVIVARFVREYDLAGIGPVWEAVCEISKTHLTAGLADPTAGGVVAGAVSEIANIDPPQSWSNPMKDRFKYLPFDVQQYIAQREYQRDKEVKRAQAEAATARHALAAIQKPKVEDAKTPKAA